MKEKKTATYKKIETHNKIAAMISMVKMLNDQLPDDAKKAFAEKVKQDPDILRFLISKELMPVKVAERFIPMVRDLINSVETLNTKGMN